MKEYDIDKIMKEYDAFVEIVRQISMSAEEQIQKLKGTVVTDEIATDFSEIGVPYARNLLVYGWISQEQFDLVQDIDEKLNQMTQKKELWNNDALLSSIEWENCRKKGKNLLGTLEI